MITIEHIVGFAIRDRVVLERLGEALRSDLVLANPYYRRIIDFADDFMLERRTLPASGDWDMWLESLTAGMLRDGTREALSKLLTIDLSAFTATYFAEQALTHMQATAVQVARARLNQVTDVPLDAFKNLSEQIEHVRLGGIQGLANLADIEVWAHPQREDDLIRTGFDTLNNAIGGWGKELWIVFADSGKGKSMFLQNCGAHIARQGKRVLHITLELGIRPQIHRYYRQLAEVTRADFARNIKDVRKKLHHWFKFAQGELVLLQYPAYTIEPDGLKRTIERVGRAVGDVDVLILDYLDLLTLPRQVAVRRGYEDLGRITHEVRGLCPTYDLTVITASQAVRKPEKKGRLTIRDMGDSYNKVRGADGLLGLCQTKEEEEMHQGRLSILKVRDSGGMGREFDIYINRDLALMADLNHPNTIALRTKLGHLLPPQQQQKGGLAP
jgi:archaellum biogenesis ATPase FlaH